MAWLETSMGAGTRPPGAVQAGPLARARAAEAGRVGRSGSLETRLAASEAEVHAAQRLRYEVFFEEGSGRPGAHALLTGRDEDGFDAVSDHLLVLDHEPGRPPRVVATSRLLRGEIARRHGGFYSASEFELEPWLSARPAARVVELGRSCVLDSHRATRAVELLWQGIWAYALRHGTEAMIGCASLPGTDPGQLRPQLSYLHHRAPMPPGSRIRALPGRRAAVDVVPPGLLDERAAFRALPPLVKGYLRLGATFGDGVVVDPDFGTTDVFAMLAVGAIGGRYRRRFGPRAG